jgi:hypothetical protein
LQENSEKVQELRLALILLSCDHDLFGVLFVRAEERDSGFDVVRKVEVASGEFVVSSLTVTEGLFDEFFL